MNIISRISSSLRIFDVTLFSAILCIMLAGLFTMSSFQAHDGYFWKQSLWIVVTLLAYVFVSRFEYRFLKQTQVVVILYVGLLSILSLLFVVGPGTRRGRFNRHRCATCAGHRGDQAIQGR
jgi:cell division protein FtsW (lipid II flippase)